MELNRPLNLLVFTLLILSSADVAKSQRVYDGKAKEPFHMTSSSKILDQMLPRFRADIPVSPESIGSVEKATQTFLKSDQGKSFLESPNLLLLFKSCMKGEIPAECQQAIPLLLQELGHALVDYLASGEGISEEFKSLLKERPDIKEQLSHIAELAKRETDKERVKDLHGKFAKIFLSSKGIPVFPSKLEAALELPLKDLESLIVQVGARAVATNPELLGGLNAIAEGAGAMKVVLLKTSPETGKPRLVNYLNSIAEGKPSSEMSEIEKRVYDNIRRQVRPLLKSLQETPIERSWGKVEFKLK